MTLHIQFQRLLANLWLESYGELLPMDEETLASSEHFYYTKTEMPQFEEDMYRNVRFTNLVRSGAIYVIDPSDTPLVPFAPDRALTELPPLPFKSVFFEFALPGVAGALPVHKFIDLDGRESTLFAVGIHEAQAAAEWRVYLLYNDKQFEDRQDLALHMRLAVREYTLLPGPVFGTHQEEIDKSGITEEVKDKFLAMAYVLPVALVQLVTVLGAEHEPVTVPRPHRRRYQARRGMPFPSIYRVDLSGAGETESAMTTSGRHLSVRFLVRGHYRRESAGEFDVPGKGKCGWVRSHVRGPKGAPWGGRQVRVKS